MEEQIEITAEQILKNRRARRTSKHSPEEAASLPAPAPKEIRKAVTAQFSRGGDAGLWNCLASPVLAPPNPFDGKQPRRLRQEAAVLGSLILILAGLAIYFNVFAR